MTASIFPIPQFVRIEQNQTTDAINELIVEINAILLYGGVAPVTGSVTRQQWFSAVSSLYNMSTLYQAVPADPNSATWIQFWAGSRVVPGDGLATLTQSTFSLNAAQMTALFAYAGTLTP